MQDIELAFVWTEVVWGAQQQSNPLFAATSEIRLSSLAVTESVPVGEAT